CQTRCRACPPPAHLLTPTAPPAARAAGSREAVDPKVRD
ncbi:MAG: hypothetical protein AVDCRST_MAG79-1293, partial [uncultured Thermoleophilia bacterium]